MSSENQQHIPLIDRTYRVELPNGRATTVNCFDLNMYRFADLNGGCDRYIQLSDSAWIRHRLLTILDHTVAVGIPGEAVTA